MIIRYNNMFHEDFWQQRGISVYVIEADPLIVAQSQRLLYYMIPQFPRLKGDTFKKTYLSGIKRGFIS